MARTAAASRPHDVTRAPLAATRTRAIIWAATLAAVAQTAVGAVNALAIESTFLNPDIEGSLFQILSALVTALAGAAALAHARLLPARRGRFAALGAILLYFAVDDAFALHEPLGEAVGEGLFGLPDHIAVRLWIVVLAPLLVAAFALLVAEALRVERPLGRVLLGGLGALVAAVLVEVVGVVTRSPTFIEDVSGKPETLRYLLEEALELGGWVLLAGGLWALVARDTGGAALLPADAQSG